jgi:hypothetical protein
MKAILSFLLLSASSFACPPGTKCGLMEQENSNRPFADLKSCESFAQMSRIKAASYASTDAKKALEYAYKSTDEFKVACAQYQNNKQDNPAISRYSQAGSRAGESKILARDQFNQAMKDLSAIEQPVKNLGADACLQDIKKMQDQLKTGMASLNAKSESVAACSESPLVDRRPRWNAKPDNKSCGVTGCEQLPNGQWTLKQL